jgi:hypothetical protein
MNRFLRTLRSLTKRLSARKHQAGLMEMTLVGLTASALMGVSILAGAWLAYGNFTFQMRLMNADRQMDQYASSAMQHLSNYLSWSWGGEPVGGGTTSSVWKFMIMDQYNRLDPLRYRVRDDFITVRCQPSGGLYITDQQPQWARDQMRDQYVWRGRPNQGSKLYAFDRRDGMSVMSFNIDYPAVASNIWELKYATVRVTLKMQYRYSAQYGISLYANQYVHERIYTTTIFMRNWDISKNDYKDHRKSTSGAN